MRLTPCTNEEIEIYVSRFNSIICDESLVTLTTPLLVKPGYTRLARTGLLCDYLDSLGSYVMIGNSSKQLSIVRAIGFVVSHQLFHKSMIRSKNLTDNLRGFLELNNNGINKDFIRDLSFISDGFNYIYPVGHQCRDTVITDGFDAILKPINEFKQAIANLELTYTEYVIRLNDYISRALELYKSSLYSRNRLEFKPRREDVINLDIDAVISSYEVAQSISDIMKL